MKWRQGFSGSKSTERRAICGWHEIIPTIGRSAPVVSTRRHKVLDNVFPNSLCSRLTESKFSGRSLASSVNLSRKNKSLPAPKLAWASIFFTAGLGQSIPVVSVHNVVMPRQQTVENLVRLAPAVLFFWKRAIERNSLAIRKIEGLQGQLSNDIQDQRWASHNLDRPNSNARDRLTKDTGVIRRIECKIEF